MLQSRTRGSLSSSDRNILCCDRLRKRNAAAVAVLAGGTNFCSRRRSRRRIFFLSIEKRRCQACGWPARHVIFATEIRTPGEPSSRRGATRPSVSKRDSLSFGMDYRRGAALETIYRYDISRAVLSLCNAILYNLSPAVSR